MRPSDLAGPSAGALPAATYPARYGRAWVWFLVVGTVGVGAYVLLDRGLPRDVLYVAFGLAAAAAIEVGVRINRPRRPLAWHLMALGTLVWCAADAINAWVSDVQDDDTFPTLADPTYLAGYVAMAGGLLLLIRDRRPRGDLAGFLDSAIMTVALGLLTWVLLVRPTIASHQDSAVAATFAAAYPVADVVLVGLLVRLVTTPGGRSRAFRLLVLAILLLVCGDMLTTGFHLTTWDASGHLDQLWLASYLAWGACALDPSMVSLAEPLRPEPVRFTRTRLAALAVAALVAPAVLAVETYAGVPVNVWAVVIGSLAVFGLVIWRMHLSIQQIQVADDEREAAQVALAHQAAHDSLTGLPNRAQVLALVRGALGRAQRSGAVVGLLFVDLDGFKQVNDTLGHAAGDEVLAAAARRMQECVRTGDVVGRLGGDEFVVLLEPVDEQASAVAVAERMVLALGGAMTLRGQREVTIGASIGVAIAQDGSVDPERLVNEADIAVYRAKVGGRGRVEVFDSSLRQEIDRRAALRTGLVAAIAAGDLQLRHEPVVDLQAGRLAGYEAVVSWPRPGADELTRAQIVPVAERTELVCELDSWVLREAARQLAEVPEGSGPAMLCIPVSGRHLVRPRVVADVVGALEAARLAPARLVLVVAENDLTDDARLLGHLGRLRALGVRVCLDGFGTREGPTDRWARLPVDLVRLDPATLAGGAVAGSMLLRLTVETAHTFGWEVVGSGTGDLDQARALAATGCRYAQGPMSRRTVAALTEGAPGDARVEESPDESAVLEGSPAESASATA